MLSVILGRASPALVHPRVRFCGLGSALTTKNCRAGKSEGQTEPELGQQTEENVSDLIQLDCQYLGPQSQQIQLSSYNSNAVNRPDSPSPDASLWPHLLTLRTASYIENYLSAVEATSDVPKPRDPGTLQVSRCPGPPGPRDPSVGCLGPTGPNPNN